MGVVDKVRDIVEEACSAGSNHFGTGALLHTRNVTFYSKKLAQKLGADIEITEISALLHDYASIKDKNLYPEHHIHGAKEAEEILQNLGYDPERIEKIKHCIYAHRGSKDIPRETIEAKSVANGDAMSHFNAVHSLLYLAYVIHGMGINEGKDWVRAKLERSWNKLTPEAKEIIQDKYEASKIILE